MCNQRILFKGARLVSVFLAGSVLLQPSPALAGTGDGRDDPGRDPGKRRGARAFHCDPQIFAGLAGGPLGPGAAKEVNPTVRVTPPLDPKDMHYEILGERNPETIVMIHGLDSATKTWETVAPELAKKYRVILVDQRGHGKTPAVGTDYSNKVMADDVAGLLKHLGVQKCHLVGHSMGGRTAVQLAADHPELVDTLIVEDIDIDQRAPAMDAHERRALEEDAQTLAAHFGDRLYSDRESMVAALATVYGRREAESLAERRCAQRSDGRWEVLFRPDVSVLYGSQANAEDLTGALKAVQVPTLFLRADDRMGSAMTRRGVTHIHDVKPTAPVKQIEGAGHSIHKDRPSAFVRNVDGFIQWGKQPQVRNAAKPAKEFTRDPEVMRTLNARLEALQWQRLPAGVKAPVIATAGTTYTPEIAKARLVPRGSAVLTSSGDLAREASDPQETPIKAIIHAASGSMMRMDPDSVPSIEGVDLSVRNSIALAKAHGYRRVAVPFIGSKIFIDRIGIKPEDLATVIVKAALESRGDTQIRFVLVSLDEKRLFNEVLAKVAPGVKPEDVSVLQGSITDRKLHGAEAIVNAANMEVQFGGGLSGAIAKAAGYQHAHAIDEEAAQEVRTFNADLMPMFEEEPAKK